MKKSKVKPLFHTICFYVQEIEDLEYFDAEVQNYIDAGYKLVGNIYATTHQFQDRIYVSMMSEGKGK
jgi:hypothetical protein